MLNDAIRGYSPKLNYLLFVCVCVCVCASVVCVQYVMTRARIPVVLFVASHSTATGLVFTFCGDVRSEIRCCTELTSTFCSRNLDHGQATQNF